MATTAGGFKSAWSNRRWRRYLVALGVSSIGDFMYAVGLAVYLVEETGSATWLAAAAIVRMLTYTVLGPIGGVVADRYDRRRLMMMLDAGRVALMMAAGLAIVAGGSPLIVLLLASATAALTTPYRPAAIAATPLLVGEDDLAAANAAEASVSQLAWFIGPALGAAIVVGFEPAAAFFVNGVTFVLSGLLIAGVGSIGSGSRSEPHHDHGPLAQLVEGGRALKQVPGLAALTGMLVAVLFAFGIETVVQVLVVTQRLGRDAGSVGILLACVGVGGILAVPFAAKLGSRPDAGRLLAISGVLMGAPLVLLAVTTNFYVACGLMVIEGLGNILLDVMFVTLLQRACPDRLLGRVFSLQDSASSCAQLAGSIAAPLLIATADLELALVVGGGSLTIVSLSLAASLQAISNRTEAERAALAPLVDELAGIGILGDARRASLERLARGSRTVSVDVGEVVFGEGDPPADLYIVREGEVAVHTAADGVVRHLTAGDWFGEIGLMRRVPRTATVTAVAPTQLLVVPGELFVDAIDGLDRMPDPLGATMRTRLVRTHPHMLDVDGDNVLADTQPVSPP
jgi:CRP-like cAMP-binding protein/predicted MFS family arabinose efflux permease